MNINRGYLTGLELALATWDKTSSVLRYGILLRDLIAQAQAAPVAEPVAEVSHETFSSDGTSDIITCNLPIGTKLYTAPQHDAKNQRLRGLLERCQERLDPHRDAVLWGDLCDALAGSKGATP